MTAKRRQEAASVEILIAEDSSTQALSLQYLLEQEGYSVVVCENGQQALEAARKRKPTLVISDIVMPELDGYGLCRALKADPRLAEIPVLLVTTLNDPEDVLLGLDAGADSFILKPYDDPFLLNRVRFVLLHRQMRRTERTDMGVEINFKGRSHFITSDRLQILNLLLSTYEAAIHRNEELRRSEEELRQANHALTEANAKLEEQIRQRELAEAQVRRLSQDLLEASQAQLQQSQERFRQLLDIVPAAIYASDVTGRIQEYNRAAAALWGQEPQPSVDGKAFHSGCTLEQRDGASVSELPMESATDRPEFIRNAELAMLRPDGSRVEVLVNTAPIRDRDGLPAGAINCLLDVTELNQAQRQLRRVAERLTTTLESITDGFYTVDRDWRFTYINHEAERVLRRTRSDLLGQDIWSEFPDARGTEFERQYRAAVLHHEATEFESYYPALDVWVDVHAYPSDEGLAVYFRDITKRKQAELALRQSEESLRLAVDAGGLGTWRWSTASGLIEVSRETRAMFGLPSSVAITYEAFIDALHPQDRGHIEAKLQKAMNELSDFRADFRIVRPNGSVLWLASLGRSCVDEGREGLRMEGVTLDITERKQSEIELRELNEQLEQRVERRTRELATATHAAEAANEAKSAFLATMSHEIRTPMNGIVGMVDVLAHGRLTEHQGDAVRTIRESAFALLHLIDDVLDFSKIEAGRLDLERMPVVLADIAEGVCDTLSPVADGKNVDLFLFISPAVSVQVWSDPGRLRQILYNLVGNAIKFSSGRPGRRGRVELRVIPSESPQRIRFSIEDDGIGMSEATQRQLFQSFQQGEVSTTRRFGGTGLGLAICKRLVDLMSGDIGVQSDVGTGSTFTVELPLEAIDGSKAVACVDLSGVDYVLVAGPAIKVEDLRVYLEYAGARTHMVCSGKEAIRKCAELASPVVVYGPTDEGGCDVGLSMFADLPGIRHLLISRGRRRVARLIGPDVVAIDGNAMRRRSWLHAAAVAAGRASPAELPQRMEDEATPPQAAPTIAQARAQGRLILVAEDDTTNQKVLSHQLGLLGYAAEIASDGLEALRLWREGRHALLLTDLHMPGLDGYGLTSAIRHEEDDRQRMPILALTANALRGEAARSKAAGLDECLTKPVQLTMLRAMLEKWLPVAKASPAPPSDDQQGSQGERQPEGGLDLDVFRNIVGDVSPDALREVLLDYKRSARMAIADLRVAMALPDLERAGSIAHRLTSSSRTVGALALGNVCAQLEDACRLADAGAAERAMMLLEPAVAQVLAQVRHCLVTDLPDLTSVSGEHG